MRFGKWSVLGVAGLRYFFLGALAHRQHTREPFRAAAAYALGESGGCSLRDLLQFRGRLQRALDGGVAGRSQDGGRDSGWIQPVGDSARFPWCPPGNTPAFAVGEQLAEVYTEGDMALGPGDVVLDCGANIGDFVRVCLRAGVAKVVAIEPSPMNVEAMRRTFAREIASGQVVLVPKGVWHEDSTMTMLLYQNSLLDSFVMRDRRENAEGRKPREVELPVAGSGTSRHNDRRNRIRTEAREGHLR